MEYTKEVKKEADSVVEKYRPFAHTWDCYNDEPLNDEYVIKCAIQDRQSVLDYAIRKSNEKDKTYDKHEFSDDIQSLSNQIEYLKSKI